MVDISRKSVTTRRALAFSTVILPRAIMELNELFTREERELLTRKPDILLPVSDIQSAKGAVLATATVASIQAVKQTPALIPMCHTLPVSACRTLYFLTCHPGLVLSDRSQCALPGEEPQTDAASLPQTVALVSVLAVTTAAPTGVEMEALTGATVASLTVVDMLKAATGPGAIMLGATRLIAKFGGKSPYGATDPVATAVMNASTTVDPVFREYLNPAV